MSVEEESRTSAIKKRQRPEGVADSSCRQEVHHPYFSERRCVSQRRRVVDNITRNHENDNHQQDNHNRRKRVRISTAPLMVQRLDARSEFELQNTWYTSSDYEAARHDVREMCQLYRQTRRFSGLLSRVYEAACNLAAQQQQQQQDPVVENKSATGASSQTTDSDEAILMTSAALLVVPLPPPPPLLEARGETDHEQESSKPPPKPPPFPLTAAVDGKPSDDETGNLQPLWHDETATSTPQLPDKESLTAWVSSLLGVLQQEGPPRGLEGYSSRLHALRRARHVQDCKHAVFVEQARQSLVRQSSPPQPQRLAQQAAQASARAKWFAALLGQADAWAVRLQDEQQVQQPQQEDTQGQKSRSRTTSNTKA